MSARILVAGRSEICRELFNDPEAYGSHIADRLSCINKPAGCLWGSTLLHNGGYPSDWLRWVASEGFMLNKYSSMAVSFKLSRKAKICTIDTVEDYHRLMRKYAKPKYENSEYSSLFKEKVIDWKKLSKDYDAFHLTEWAFWEMRLPLSNILECEDGSELCDFYSYDCESWILFNLDCINWGSVINQDVKIKSLYDD